MKLLIVYNWIQPYRSPFFEKLGEELDLTVVCDKTSYTTTKFTLLHVTSISLGRFKLRIGLWTIDLKAYDRVIFFVEPNYPLDILRLVSKSLFSKQVGTWGCWPTSSQAMNFLRFFIIKRTSFNYFYCHEHLEYYRLKGAPLESLRVAPNSIETSDLFEKSYDSSRALNILFIGSLHQRKGLKELLECFLEFGNKVNFRIVGSGDLASEIESFIDLHKPKNIQRFNGTNHDNELKEHFSWCDLTINNKQAGLSVLSSIQRGIPVLCYRDAISGGEKFAITHGLTGYFYIDMDDLVARVNQILDNQQIVHDMSKNCAMYEKERNISSMVKSFLL